MKMENWFLIVSVIIMCWISVVAIQNSLSYAIPWNLWSQYILLMIMLFHTLYYKFAMYLCKVEWSSKMVLYS